MYFYDNGGPEESLLFVSNFNMTLATSEMLEAYVKAQYLRTLVCGEELRPFYLLSDDVGSMQTLKVDYIIKGLAQYFPPVN